MPQNCNLFWLAFLLSIKFSFCQTQPSKYQEAFDFLVISDSLLFKADYNTSLEYSSKALNIAFELNDKDLMALAYNSIAGNMEEILEFDKALHYYKKSINSLKTTGNDSLYVWVYNNIGNVYLNQKMEIDSSIYYFQESLKYAEKRSDKESQVITNLNLAWAYFQKDNFTKANSFLEQGEKNIHLYNYPDVNAFLNILKGISLSKQFSSNRANEYFEKAIAVCLEYENNYFLSSAYKHYAEHLSSIGNFKKAYQYLDLYQKQRENELSLEKLKSIELKGLQLELDENQRQINVYENENALQSEIILRSKIITSLFIVFVFLMVFVVLVLYKNIKFKRNINEFLTLKNEELEQAKERAEEASKLKTQFISTVSHELRTPLYGVVGITNMLSEEHPVLAESQHLNSLKFSARYLLSLVNDLLQINKIEEKNIELENHAFNLHDELQLVIKSLSYMAERNQNTIKIILDDNIPEIIVGDKLRLSQILMNLISNALKFTKEGKVSVEVNLKDITENFVKLEFKVQDTGIGIPENELPKIFEKFVQVGRKEDDYQGTGLGLSIVLKLIELFKGSIKVESILGEGTTFIFNINFETSPSKIVEIVNSIVVDLSTDKQYRVLVVEDNKINQMVTKKIMDKNHYKTLIVDDGYAAIEALGKESFDVILMDINMPLINGFETTRMIRKKGINIPIIALTAFAKDEISEEAKECGMNEILIKPFEATKLNQLIESLVKS